MKIRLLLLYLLYVWGSMVYSQQKINYNVNSIPHNLFSGSYAVVRDWQETFEVKSIKEAIHSRKYAITVLNKSKIDLSYFIIHYDKTSKVNNVSGTIYDKYGNIVKKIKKSDILDISAVSGGTLYSDARAIVVDPGYSTYPFTVEYEFEKVYKGMLHYPVWQPQMEPEVSIVEATFVFMKPSNLGSRYKALNLTDPVINTEEDMVTYTWKVRNLQPVEDEILASPFSERVPTLYNAPDEFFFDGYSGSMESWNSIGKWVNDLNRNRDILDSRTVNHLQNLVKEKNAPIEKIKIIYDYLQNNTRYVSIQLGIGGYQPPFASFVDEKGYGDCKALTIYTKAMLKSVGIDSHYALVRSGSNVHDILVDFPSLQFDHVILCVPNSGDTIWLECTSQDVPFGYIGNFTDDRNALIIKENGGEVVRTKRYKGDENLQITKAEVILKPNGSGTSHIKIRFEGLQYDNVSEFLSQSQDEQKKFFYAVLDIPDFKVNEFNLQQINKNKGEPQAMLEMNIDVNSYFSNAGDRVFFPLNFMNKRRTIPGEDKNRQSDIRLTFSYYDIDSIVYQIPDRMLIEYLPEDVRITSDFGIYSASAQKIDDNKILYVRTLKMNDGRFSLTKYGDLVEFFKGIVNADKQKVVLKKD